MIDPRAIVRGAAATVVATLVIAAALASAPSRAFALAPHVPTSVDTDSCAMCHRGHTSASEIEWEDARNPQHRGNALIVGDFEGSTEEQLCYVCHGVDGLGSESEVQDEFLLESKHVMAPEASDYGPSPKSCRSCHDSHGSDRKEDGNPFAALLRVRSTTESGTSYNSGDNACGACHADRANDTWDGMGVWSKTAHSKEITAGITGVVCSACHEPHGSDAAPLITQSVDPPAVPEAVPVAGNDRTLCYACHAEASGSFGGIAAYDSSTHGLSSVATTVPGEWPARTPQGSAETTRVVGECQVCHSPMGTDDGTGNPLPKLLNADGKELCYRCHKASSSPAADIASLDPAPSSGLPEIAMSYGSAPTSPEFGLLQVHSKLSAATAGVPNPRQFLRGNVGAITAGDFDGDSKQELLVARGGSATITAFGGSDLSGLDMDPGNLAILAPTEHLLVADVMPDALSLPEVVTADGTTVRFYRWNSLSLSPVASVTMTGTVTGIAAGNVQGLANAEVAVTSNDPDRLEIISGESGTPQITGSFPTRALPTGPSVGDMSGDGFAEIAVANAGEAANIASVFNADGSEYGVAVQSTGNEFAVSTAIGDVLTAVDPAGTNGRELVVLTDNHPTSSVHVFVQANGGGLAVPCQSKDVLEGGNPGHAVVADVDGDGAPEVAVALAGTTASDASAAAPGLFVVDVQGDNATLGGTSRHVAAGTEAGSDESGRAWIVVRDLGNVGPARHQAGAAPRTHVSTETVDFARHVECADCHNTHETTSTAQAAPYADGALKGAWGVSVLNAPAGSITYTLKRGVTYEYELCLKCHGQFGATGRTRDVASEFDTRNASFHAVEGVATNSEATAGSFVPAVPAWGNDSRVRCTDCHGNSDGTAAQGPHTSANAPILRKPYTGALPSSASLLCYECHRSEVYLDGSLDGLPGTTSLFYDPSLAAGRRALHKWHTEDKSIACSACHNSHGGTRQHMIRGNIGYTHTASGGSCTNGCHGGSARSYSR